MRLFVAVDLDDAARALIAEEQHRLRARASSGSPLRWVKPEHLHITLVFLGEIREPLVNAIIGAYADRVPLVPFEVVFRGVGAFPEHGAPRALWIGVGEGQRDLIQLQQLMAARARSVNVPLETRPFSPHLTIGRWKESRSSDRRLVAGARDDVRARVRVTRATLYQSLLGSNGPTYVPRAHATLTSSR